MKTSTVIFVAAGAVVVIAVLMAMSDLMRHQATTYGVTPSPSTAPVAPLGVADWDPGMMPYETTPP